MALAACMDSRPAVPPPPVGVSMLITLNKWPWILDGDRRRHAAAGSARSAEGARRRDQTGAVPGGDAAEDHRAGEGDDAVLVEIGYGDKVYDSRPLGSFAEKATIQAGFGVRNWIRIRDGERTIEIGSLAGRKGAGIIIELGPGISTSEY